MNRYLLPLLLFAIMIVYLAIGLTKDPRIVPSPLIGKQVTDFELPSLHNPEKTLTPADLVGRVTMINVWATWCVACRQEHALLLEIADEVPIYGLNYRDVRVDAIRWLDELGDPYVDIAFDEDGRVGIDFGVYGAPETFILDANGVIVHKQIGPITAEIWRTEMLPVIEEFRRHVGGAR